jgi:glutathionylspermidine synthase
VVPDASDRSSYDDFARSLLADGVLGDPWLEGQPRFALEPLLLEPARARALYAAAEGIAAALAEAAALCLRRPALLERLGLSSLQRWMWLAAAPDWHLLARADVFWTDRGPMVCEVNSDTPSGEAEAVLLNAYAAARHPAAVDLNADLGRRYTDAVAAYAARVLGRDPGRPLAAALIYPTELTEDLSMIALYRRWFAARGWNVTLGSPYNLCAQPGGGLALFESPCDLVVRHYKTDWWTERRPVWRDEAPFPDAEPLAGPLAALLQAATSDAAAIVNPLGAVLTQNKRTLALLWEERSQLSPAAQEAIARYLPFTARMECVPVVELARAQAEWVLKSDYGCEGDEVIVGAEVAPLFWRETLARALPGRWIVQRRFRPERDRAGVAVNHGVYVVAGRAAGILARLSAEATDRYAITVPALMRT